MTISSTVRTAGPYTGTGSVSTYPFAFKVFQASDVLVVRADPSGNLTTLALTTDYSVTLNANQDNNPGGSVVLNAPLATSYQLTISSQVPELQGTAITNNGGFYPKVIESSLDYLTVLVQQIQTSLNRCLQLPLGVSGVSTLLPAPVPLDLIGWNGNGTGLQNISPASLATQVAYGAANADVFTGNGVQTVFTLSNNPGSQNNLKVSVGGVTQTPGVDFTWASSTTLTFTVAPPNGATIVAQYDIGLPQGFAVAANVSFTQAGTGAVARTSQDKMRDVVCVFDFMTPAQISDAKAGTQTLDLTAAMQAAHNTGNAVYYPKGTYRFSTLAFTTGGIIGDGESYTVLQSSDTGTGNTISLNSTNLQPGGNAPVFRGFALKGLPAKTSGSGLIITAPSSENQGAQLKDVTFYTFPTCLAFGAASGWNIHSCKFINYLSAGITVANTNNPDSGDSTITGCLFTTSVGSSQVGINYQSSGGLKVIGNKFNGGAYGFFLALNAALDTSDLLILGNSIENQTVAGIELSRSSGTAKFSNVVIVGNQIAICPNGIVSDASGFLYNLTIQGNSFQLTSGTGVCINLSSATNFNIAGNVFQGNGGTPGGVSIAAACVNGKIGKNVNANLTTAVANASATTLVGGDLQTGTGSVTTSTPYGVVYIGAQSITFPTPFNTVPVVHCYPNTGSGGGISGFATAVTKTGFNLNIIGATNGGSVSCAWDAEGVV